jgi:MSHA pilin protein MshD
MSTKSLARVRQRGISLLEVVIFIVVVAVAVAGVLSVLDVSARSSADPVIHKQMLSVAEALLEEVQMQPFTHCDPSDANAAIATSASTLGSTTPCASLVQTFGQQSGQTRTPYTFNNVANYCAIGTTGSTTCPVLTLSSPIAGVVTGSSVASGYSATIALTAENLGPAGLSIVSTAPTGANDASAMNVLRIGVTVNYKLDSVTLEGYRTRYAPNYFP